MNSHAWAMMGLFLASGCGGEDGVGTGDDANLTDDQDPSRATWDGIALDDATIDPARVRFALSGGDVHDADGSFVTVATDSAGLLRIDAYAPINGSQGFPVVAFQVGKGGGASWSKGALDCKTSPTAFVVMPAKNDKLTSTYTLADGTKTRRPCTVFVDRVETESKAGVQRVKIRARFIAEVGPATETKTKPAQVVGAFDAWVTKI